MIRRRILDLNGGKHPVILANKYVIDKVYPPLTYFDIKKILIRMKDRKFLTR